MKGLVDLTGLQKASAAILFVAFIVPISWQFLVPPYALLEVVDPISESASPIYGGGGLLLAISGVVLALMIVLSILKTPGSWAMLGFSLFCLGVSGSNSFYDFNVLLDQSSETRLQGRVVSIYKTGNSRRSMPTIIVDVDSPTALATRYRSSFRAYLFNVEAGGSRVAFDRCGGYFLRPYACARPASGSR